MWSRIGKLAAVRYAVGGLIAATGIGQPTFDLRNLISSGQELTFDFITGLIFDDFEAAAFELWASANPGLPVAGAARIDKLLIREGMGFPPLKAQPFIAGSEQLTVAFMGELEGDIAPFPSRPLPIPTASIFGLFVLASLLALGGPLFLRRRLA